MTEPEDAPEPVGDRSQAVSDGKQTTARAMKWNLVAVAGKQAFTFVAAIVIARLLGPQTYGVISAATVYVTFTTLLLDQGLAAALIQRPQLDRHAAGAVASANLLTGVVLALATFGVAPFVAQYFDVAELTDVLRWLGLGLIIKAVAIAPRALKSRALDFRAIAVADVAGAAVGATAGVLAALGGAGPAAVVWQTFALDIVVSSVLVSVVRGPVPNLRFGEVRSMLPFGLRVLTTNGIAFFSRNIDNVLVGRYLGIEALSYYGMAYRVLVIPVQLIGQTVSRVMFPAFSRVAHDREVLADRLISTVEMLAVITVPLMGLAAVSSHDLVAVVLGSAWLPAAPVMSVLAIAGARETVFYVTGPLMTATGQVKLALRYEVLATALQVTGIVVGLQFSVFGVALGYTVAGFVLAPVLLVIQRRLTGLRLRQQLLAIGPAVHVSTWAALGYALVALAGLSSMLTLVLGALVYVGVAMSVLALVHRGAARRVREMITMMFPGTSRKAPR